VEQLDEKIISMVKKTSEMYFFMVNIPNPDKPEPNRIFESFNFQHHVTNRYCIPDTRYWIK